jgi:transposase-like protein
MKQQHSEAFREQALRKVLERGMRPIQAVASDLGLKIGTLKGWMKVARRQGGQGSVAAGTLPADNETPSGRLDLLLASAGLSADQLHAWCRERGIYAHQLATWKAAFALGAEVGALKPLRQERDALRHERDGLQRQLLRKDKALAEAAALLVLSKKFQALLAGEVE